MKFNDAIKLGNFVKAKELASQMDMDFLRETLFLLAYDKEEIATYGFISYLLHEEPPMNFKFIQLTSALL